MTTSRDALIAQEEYECGLYEFISYIKSCRTAQGVEEVLLPGELEWRLSQARKSSGISFSEADWRELTRLAGYCG